MEVVLYALVLDVVLLSVVAYGFGVCGVCVFNGASEVGVVKYHDGKLFVGSMWRKQFGCKEGCVAYGIGRVPIVGCNF